MIVDKLSRYGCYNVPFLQLSPIFSHWIIWQHHVGVYMYIWYFPPITSDVCIVLLVLTCLLPGLPLISISTPRRQESGILCLKIKSLFQIHISIVDSIAVKLMWNYTSVYIRFCVQFSLFAIRFLVEFLNNVLHFIIIHIQAHNL